jgi:hypothetical protein
MSLFVKGAEDSRCRSVRQRSLPCCKDFLVQTDRGAGTSMPNSQWIQLNGFEHKYLHAPDEGPYSNQP